MNEIGFMQGRLSAPVNNKIQAFPWESWKEEFVIAKKNGFRLMEWTLDYDRLYENPLMTESGQREINDMSKYYSVNIRSLTGDCFMQSPFWKASKNQYEKSQQEFSDIINACSRIGIEMIIVPLVDNGRLENRMQEDLLVDFLKSQSQFLIEKKVKVIFECDYIPKEFTRFINRLDTTSFGINYDIGNSASLGFSSKEELNLYGDRILNVHVKDRLLNGTTVPLGTGNADFEGVFSLLALRKYAGNFILQTARASEGNHSEVLCRYRSMTEQWLRHYAA